MEALEVQVEVVMPVQSAIIITQDICQVRTNNGQVLQWATLLTNNDTIDELFLESLTTLLLYDCTENAFSVCLSPLNLSYEF